MAEFEHKAIGPSIYRTDVVDTFKTVIANMEEGLLISEELTTDGKKIKTTEQTPMQPGSEVKGFKFRTTGRGLGEIFRLVTAEFS